jgi:hypothetical protein
MSISVSSVSVAHLFSHNFNISPNKCNGTFCMPFPFSSIVTHHGPLLTVFIPCTCFPPAHPALLFCFLVISCHVTEITQPCVHMCNGLFICQLYSLPNLLEETDCKEDTPLTLPFCIVCFLLTVDNSDMN